MSSRGAKTIWVLYVELPNKTTIELFENQKDAYDYGVQFYKDFQVKPEVIHPTTFKNRKRNPVKLKQESETA